MNWLTLIIMITWFGYGVWAAHSKKSENYRLGVGALLIVVWTIVALLILANGGK